ncbi:hypothetical protein BDC45DRAFT_514074 [Circinella umbellata]|nr:hypothetical protein BDC45DRAFT_514074 [Circinella umbellata]
MPQCHDDTSSASTVHVSIDQLSTIQDERRTDSTLDNDDSIRDEESQRPPTAAEIFTSKTTEGENNKEHQIIDQQIEDETCVDNPKGVKGMLFNGKTIAMLLVVGGGTAVAFQSAANGAMRVTAGRSFSAVTNFVVGLFMEILAFLFDILILKTPKPTIKGLKESPWFSWIGGILGTYYVIVNIFTVTQMGAGVVLSVFVCAQVIMGCIMDHFGLTGIPKRRYSIWRILASLGLIGCVAVITIF